jgi:signal transduction histidine kinase
MKTAGLPAFEFGENTAAETLPDSLSSGAYSREAILVGGDRRRISVVVNAARVPRSSRSRMRYYASITDISALREAQERLKRQNVELRAASKAKSEFLANMSHELRTPLNAIIGFSAAFVNGLFGRLGDPRYQEYAQDINDSGNHLLRIINDILDLSKIEAGHMQLNDAHLKIPTVVNSVLPLVRERAAEANVRMTTDLPDDLPLLRADDRAVKQMLINLLSNAVKFTEAGGEITVAARHEHGAILLSVADTGIGMAPEDIPRALIAFGQVDGSLSRQHQGTGLGLPLVKSLVELHQGACDVDSAPGVGTTVTLSFPKERTVHPTSDGAVRSVA